MNFKKDIERILKEHGKKKGINELKRHALVSTRNNHYCNSCFCCACVDYLKPEKNERQVKK